MKKISIVLFISLLGVILIMSKDTNKTVVNVLASFTINVLPTLAPALLINNLISFSGGISELLSKSKNSYHINIIYLIITGLISGTPALATQVNNETNKSISLNDAQLILECFSFPSLPKVAIEVPYPENIPYSSILKVSAKNLFSFIACLLLCFSFTYL